MEKAKQTEGKTKKWEHESHECEQPRMTRMKRKRGFEPRMNTDEGEKETWFPAFAEMTREKWGIATKRGIIFIRVIRSSDS
jgi:hypothetical protein